MRVTLKKRYYQRALDLGLVGKVVTCTRNEGFEDKRVVLHTAYYPASLIPSTLGARP